MINFIEAVDVTAVTLSIELEKAVLAHELKPDGSLYVNEDGFPFWLRILQKYSYLGFCTYIRFRESSTLLEKLTLANKFNKSLFMVTAYISDDELRIEHTLNFRDGLLKETFIRCSRNFAQVIERGILDFDPDYKLLMRLSEMSSENRDA